MSYVLLLNYKHLDPDYKETRCSVSQPHFRNLAPYLKRCLKKGSQNKPAEGEAAYLAQRRQNRFFLFFFSPVLLPFHLLPSGGICLRDSVPKGKSFSLKVAGFHSVAWYLTHLRLFISAYFETGISVHSPPWKRLNCWPGWGQAVRT